MLTHTLSLWGWGMHFTVLILFVRGFGSVPFLMASAFGQGLGKVLSMVEDLQVLTLPNSTPQFKERQFVVGAIPPRKTNEDKTHIR